MRRSRLALLAVAAVTALACANPHETPLPGETQPSPSQTTSSATGAPATTGADQTASVCRDARSESSSKVTQLKAEIAKAADPNQLLTALTAAAWGAGSMAVFRFLFGVGEAGAFPIATRSLSRWMLPTERGYAQGLTHAGSRRPLCGSAR